MTPTQLKQTLKAEKALAQSFENYAGQWVAILNHAVVQHSETLNGLLARVDAENVDRIQHVASEKAAFCFF